MGEVSNVIPLWRRALDAREAEKAERQAWVEARRRDVFRAIDYVIKLAPDLDPVPPKLLPRCPITGRAGNQKSPCGLVARWKNDRGEPRCFGHRDR